MANADITTLTFIGDGTQGTFFTNLATAMSSAGFSLYDSFTSGGNEGRVFSRQMSVAAKGTAYLNIQFASNTSIFEQGAATWDTSGHSGSNLSTQFTRGFTSLDSSHTFYSISHSEMRGVIWKEGTLTRSFFGYFRPGNAPPGWWNETLYPYAFIDKTLDCYFGVRDLSNPYGPGMLYGQIGVISSLAPSPISNSSLIGICGNNLRLPNPYFGNRRTAWDRPIMGDLTEGFTLGQFGTDLIVAGGQSTDILDRMQVTIGVEEYAVVENNPTGTCLCIRVV